MKLRFYMRGLGIGIIVTALIMGISFGQKDQLTDEEIKSRAAKLGMVEGGTVLSSLNGNLPESENSGGSVETVPESENSGGSVETVPESENSETVPQSESVETVPESENSGGSVETVPESENNSDSSETVPESENNSESSETVPESENNSESSETVPESENNSESSETVPESENSSESIIRFTIQRGDSSETVSRRLAQEGLVDDAAAYNAFLVEEGYSRGISVGTFQIPANSSWKDIADIITSRRR